jgi:hypothetical protein
VAIGGGPVRTRPIRSSLGCRHRHRGHGPPIRHRPHGMQAGIETRLGLVSATGMEALGRNTPLSMVDDDQSPVITLRKSTVVRAGVAVLVLAALGGGIAIGLTAGGSPSTVRLQASSVRKYKSAVSTTTSTTVPPTTVPPTTTTTVPPATTTTAVPKQVVAPPVATTTTTNPARQILSPATTPPVSNECSMPISESADGNPYPSMCPTGGVNIPAWRYITISYSNILGLGAGASEQQVLQTMCASSVPYGDVSLASEVAATYYGWSFASDPAFTGWDPGTDCAG